MVLSERARMTRHVLMFGGTATLGGVLMPVAGATVGGPVLAVGLLFAIPFALRLLWTLATDGAEQQAIDDTAAMAWRHFFAGTGIAVDTERRELLLFGDRRLCRYAFADVRSWESRVQSGGQAVGRGVAVAAHNIETGLRNAKASGLFIDVRDTERPAWRIAFPPRKLSREGARWVEILRQSVNESAR